MGTVPVTELPEWEALRAATDALYEAFSHYPLRDDIPCCWGHCITEEDDARLRARPLRELTGDDLNIILFNPGTWGEEVDFKHFLPRIFELASLEIAGQRSDFNVDIESIGSRVRFEGNGLTSWPAPERAALESFCLAWWRGILTTPPTLPFCLYKKTDAFMCTIAHFTDDLTPYLEAWQQALSDSRTTAPFAHLLVLIVNYITPPPWTQYGSRSVYWDGEQSRQWQQLHDWICDFTTARTAQQALERARTLDPGVEAQWFDTKDAEIMLPALEWIENRTQNGFTVRRIDMVRERHATILKREGVAAWNMLRQQKSEFRPYLRGEDLSGADLSGVDLRGAVLRRANLTEANLREAILTGADLSEACLTGADLTKAFLVEANLRRADLKSANLSEAHASRADLGEADCTSANLQSAMLDSADLSWTNLYEADFTRASLRWADLSGARCIHTRFSEATLTGCTVHGILTSDVDLEHAVQTNLNITPQGGGWAIIVDNLEVANSLLLHNQRARVHNQRMSTALATTTGKVVLVLGKSATRTPVLDALLEALRHHPKGYIPVQFRLWRELDKPELVTMKTLASLARFAIADLTESHAVRAELTTILSNAPSLPVQPIAEGDAELPAEYASWQQHNTFLPVFRYTDLTHLLANLSEKVIEPADPSD